MPGGIRRLALRPVSHRIYANDALDRYDVQGAVLSWFVVLTAVWPCGNRRRAGRRDSPVCRHGETAPFRPRPGPLRRRKPPVPRRSRSRHTPRNLPTCSLLLTAGRRTGRPRPVFPGSPGPPDPPGPTAAQTSTSRSRR